MNEPVPEHRCWKRTAAPSVSDLEIEREGSATDNSKTIFMFDEHPAVLALRAHAAPPHFDGFTPEMWELFMMEFGLVTGTEYAIHFVPEMYMVDLGKALSDQLDDATYESLRFVGWDKSVDAAMAYIMRDTIDKYNKHPAVLGLRKDHRTEQIFTDFTEFMWLLLMEEFGVITGASHAHRNGVDHPMVEASIHLQAALRWAGAVYEDIENMPWDESVVHACKFLSNYTSPNPDMSKIIAFHYQSFMSILSRR